MAASPSNPAHMNLVTKDAMFLFDLFRESPTPILIQIGPFAEKTGAKPNTIIKRLAGIKARNRLNISTTLGTYKHPSPSKDGGVKSRRSRTSVKTEHPQPQILPGIKEEMSNFVHKSSDGSEIDQTSSRLTTSLSSPITSPSNLYHECHDQHFEELNRVPSSVNLDFLSPKRDFEQTLERELEFERSELDGTTWKRVRVE